MVAVGGSRSIGLEAIRPAYCSIPSRRLEGSVGLIGGCGTVSFVVGSAVVWPFGCSVMARLVVVLVESTSLVWSGVSGFFAAAVRPSDG